MKDGHLPPDKPKRITLASMGAVLLNAFNLDKGLGYTLKALLLHPGEAIREYLLEDRTRMVHPLRLLLLSTAVAGFLNVQFVLDQVSFKEGFEQGVQFEAPQNEADSAEFNEKLQQEIFVDILFNFFTKYQNLILLLMVPLYAVMGYWIFYRRKFFFGEHLALSSFLVSMQNVIFILLVPVVLWSPAGSFLYIFLSLIYACYLYIQFFECRNFRTVLAAIATSFIAMLLYFLVLGIFVIGLVLVIAAQHDLI